MALREEMPNLTNFGNGFVRGEVASIYVEPDERFVVSLIVGYREEDGCTSPEEAADTALELTRDMGSSGTHWHVFDRKTGMMHVFEQSDFDTKQDGI